MEQEATRVQKAIQNGVCVRPIKFCLQCPVLKLEMKFVVVNMHLQHYNIYRQIRLKSGTFKVMKVMWGMASMRGSSNRPMVH